MQLALSSDYALRALIYMGLHREERVQVKEVAQAYGISTQHLVKIVHQLGVLGYVETRQGRGGGIRLARAPEEINLGEVIKAMEPHWILVECFDPQTNSCRIAPACSLHGILRRAQAAFLSELGRHTLADLLRTEAKLRSLFVPAPAPIG